MTNVFWEEMKIITTELIERTIRKHGFFNLYDDGKIDTVSTDGRTANVFINGDSTSTPNIPIRPGLSLVSGDEVRIININFNKKDRLIDFKKII